MKKIVPLILLIPILFIAYQKLYQNSEEHLQTPSTEAEREDNQIDKMMGINTPEDNRVKIPTH